MYMSITIEGNTLLFNPAQAEKLLALIQGAGYVKTEYMTNPQTGKYESVKLLRTFTPSDDLRMGVMLDGEVNALREVTKAIDAAKNS